MSWFKKISSIQLQMNDYEQKTLHYLYELADKNETRKQELINYTPDFQKIKSNLISIGFSNPEQAIQILQQDNYSNIFQIYKELSNIYYQLQYNDTKRNIIDDLKVEIRKISDMLDQTSFSNQDALLFAQQIIEKSRTRLLKIKTFISQTLTNIPEWNNNIIITAHEPPYDGSFSKPNYLEPISSVSISVGKQSSWGGTADFTFFADFDDNNEIIKYEIDDILESGDTDFFTENQTQNDYFSLVYELQHPGKTKPQSEKILTLYTSRPTEHRKQYLDTKTIPPNLFLTTSYSNAIGMAQDFNKRDVWKVRIKSKYLIQTMNSPQEKWYQIKPQQTPIPTESMTLIDPYEEN